jgi:sterol desaturase/sphingolipid hydroxylase (fatty acid hydroxylase superfamily)
MDFVRNHILLISTFLVAALYVVIGGLFYLFFYSWKKNPLAGLKIQHTNISVDQLRRERNLSIITLLIFCVIGYFTGLFVESGKSQLYFDQSLHSDFYFILSIILMIFLHDAYFYWTHRLLHLPGWFDRIHIKHHLSSSPNPSTALAFHPVEAIIQAAFFPLVIFIIPIHVIAFLIFLLFMVFMNVLGHSGYQLFHYSRGIQKWLSWNNSSRSHDAHHQSANGNFSLYFTFWDKWMGTAKDSKNGS